MTKDIISPVSIDLGAKNTGVYFAHYEADSSIEGIEKDGKVYRLEKDSYTLLMANRTAKRHQRRGYDRRQMVKRLFKLIWEKHFGLEWDKNVQQTTSFLFNRRGFSFLTEEYDAEILSRFPEEAYHLLPEELKIERNYKGEYDFASALTEWGNAEETRIQKCFDKILRKAYHEKIRRCCQEKKTDDAIIKEGKNSVRLGNTPKDIFEELFYKLPVLKNRMETEEYNDQNEKITIKYNKGETFNILSFINNNAVEVADAIKRTLPQEQKEWLFNPTGSFDLEKSIEKLTESENIDIKLHLHHLAFALQKILNELQSGGRHRSKYFDEVKAVLGNKTHTHTYLKTFCEELHSKTFKPTGSEKSLTDKTLSNLIAHLSNLELKPLRKYFNDENHKTGDYWDEPRLNRIFDRWIIREWRINPEKDKDKGEDKKGDYKKLCEDWNTREGGVVDFWLKTDPFSTIPPYQDNNNRRPPRCQSLILNPVYLDNHYPAWQTWLKTLKEQQCVTEYLGDGTTSFVDQLKNLPSGKAKPYYSDETTPRIKKGKNGAEREKTNEEIRAGNSQRRDLKALDARILQFIFDRVKDDDPLKLNEIYSHAKKYRQQQSRKEAKDKLEKAIECSELPDTLKTIRDYQNSAVFEKRTFLHLTCKYYKLRQRAKDGRIFIHPEYRYVKDRGYENTGRFDDDNCLLTYCNHKPRQKRYQMLGDLARILCTTEANLKNKANITEDVLNDRKNPKRLFEKIENFFKEIKVGQHGLKGFMEDCAKAQKDYGNALNESIEHNYKELEKIVRQEEEEELNKPLSKIKLKENAKSRLITETAAKRETSTREEIKTDINRLIRLKEKSHGFAGPLAERIHENLAEDEKKAIIDKFDDPFSLAQIYNIVYKERNGYSRTCFVCSKDNSLRIFNENQQVYGAKASRLPAIPTRVIDGAVMRMARITADAIIKNKWPNIKKELRVGHKVHIPIIIEANRFEFEPSKEELVKSQRVTPRKGKALTRRSDYSVKDERIKNDGQGFCPYTGKELRSNTGEIDHIIPRRSKWGTLNDEANLIWASHIGNHHKTNIHLSLGNLESNYKNAQFPGKDDAGIEQWIIEQIGTGEGEHFKFGPYRSFINLSQEQQKAFRHALFLSASHPLRNKVIEAINNRNRALVNGTQRYFAEVLANGLYKEAAKDKCKQNLLSFDYFEASTDPESSNVNVRSVRRYFEDKKDNGNYTHPELQEHLKRNETQSSYSHLIDATTAFMIALSEHYKDGSLKIDAPYISPYDYSDDNGELKDLYTALKIDYLDFKSHKGSEKLKRRKSEKGFFVHKTIFDSNAGAWHFLKLIEIEAAGKKIYLKGFLELEKLKSCLREDDWKNAIKDEYVLKVNDDTNNGLKYKKYKYGRLLNSAEKAILPDLYHIGKDTCQFGYTNEKQQWPKVIIKNQQLGKNSFTVRLHQIDKTKVAQFLQEHFNTRSNPNEWQPANCQCFQQLEKLWYFTKRKKLIYAPADSNNQEPDFPYKADNVKASDFLNPSLWKAWGDLNGEWNKYKSNNGESDQAGFLKGHFLKTRELEKSADQSHSHERTRKEFSLPVRSMGQGFMLTARKMWDGRIIYQCQAEKSGDGGTGLYKKRINDSRKLYDSLAPYFRSRNIVLLKTLDVLKDCLSEDGTLIDEDKWYGLDVPSQSEFRNVKSVENRYQSKGDSIWRIIFKETPTMKDLIDLMYGGYHIDELKVGSKPEEKTEVKLRAEKFFQKTGSFMNIEEAKEKLKQQKEAINKKYQGNNQRKTDEDKKQLKFIQCWIQCLNALEATTLIYKRGVPLKIEL